MADIVTTQVFSNGETGITATKLNNVVALSSIQPAFVSAKPVASSTVAGDNLLLLTSGGAYAKIDSSTFATSISSLLPAPEPKIWSVRLSSFNGCGNSTFEVDQRNCGALTANPVNGAWIQDRWLVGKVGTMVCSVGQNSASPPVLLPGTNYAITRNFLRVTLTTQQTVLGAGDVWQFYQNVEGCQFRELSSDVTSISLLVRSSIANLKFGLSLADPGATRSLTKLCTIPSANTWTLLTFSNIPLWSSGGAFGITPGTVGYLLRITLAAGTTYAAPANDTWQTGNFSGAVGQGNFASNPITTSTFDIAAVQHEPGSQCSTLMDKPFSQNYDDCLRYFQKSWNYATAPGAVTLPGAFIFVTPASANPFVPVMFSPRMAKTPTITGWSAGTGAINTVRDNNAGVDRAISSINNPGEGGFGGFALTTLNSSTTNYYANWTADTGW